MVGGERALEVLDRLDLAAAQARGDQERHLLQAAPERGALGQPLGERLGLVEGEHRARAWLRVAQIAEQGLDPGALVAERQRIGPGVEVLGQLGEVLLRLLGEARERGASLLGLDDAGRPAVDEQKIVASPAGSGNSRTATPRPALRFSSSRCCSTQPAASSWRSIRSRARASGVLMTIFVKQVPLPGAV